MTQRSSENRYFLFTISPYPVFQTSPSSKNPNSDTLIKDSQTLIYKIFPQNIRTSKKFVIKIHTSDFSYLIPQDTTMSENLLTLTIDGHEVKASADSSIIQAYARAGSAITANVGCMGQGVCGSCRCMIRKEGEREVTTALACETKVEEGMQVSFLDYFIPEHIQYYDVSEVGDGWNWLDDTAKAFPEAQHCRHCGGCNRACPKGLEVENGVAQVVSGDFGAAALTFDQCVMCNLCTLSCPEHIRPNHLGLFARRMKAARTLRPVDLMRRLREIDSGKMKVEFEEEAM